MSLKLERDYISLGFFLALFLAFTGNFFYVLNFMKRTGEYGDIFVVALFYFLLVAASSSFFGFFYCHLYAERHYLGYLYNLGCFILFFAFWFLRIGGGYYTSFESPGLIFGIMFGWGAGIVIHTLWVIAARRNKIKGIQKDKIFE